MATQQKNTALTEATSGTTKLPAWMRSFGWQISIALILGVLLGLVGRNLGGTETEPNWLTQIFTIVGNSYVTLLKAAVAPLIFTAVVSSIANLKAVSNAARLAGQTILWFAITALIAVTIGMILATVMRPGMNTGIDASNAQESAAHGSWLAFIQGIIPSNVLGIEASSATSATGITTNLSFNALQVLVIAIAFGIAALKIGDKAQPFLDFNAAALAIVQKILWWIIRLAPLGTLALIGKAVATYGWDALGSLGKFVGTVYLGLVIVLGIVYPALIKLHGLSIKQYFTGVWPAVQLGFASRSSVGTMPMTERVSERNLGVPREYASFAIPLGSTTKMDGCAAIYPAVAGIFVAQFYGIQLSFTHYLLIAFVSVIGSAATAGTTGATVMLTLTLSTLGLPLAGVGLLLAVDPIVDMGRTAVNVAGQALVATIVAQREGILDKKIYNAPRTSEPFSEAN